VAEGCPPLKYKLLRGFSVLYDITHDVPIRIPILEGRIEANVGERVPCELDLNDEEKLALLNLLIENHRGRSLSAIAAYSDIAAHPGEVRFDETDATTASQAPDGGVA
jgi:hypothetical protein